MKFTDEDVIKALECCSEPSTKTCKELQCPLNEKCERNLDSLERFALDLINRQKAEIERLQKLQKPTETSGYRIENGKVVFYTKILNGYRHEYESLDRVVNDMNIMLQNAYKTDEIAGHYKGKLKTAKAEAIKEFAERLKEKRTGWSYPLFVLELDAIDNLVKEMVGD